MTEQEINQIVELILSSIDDIETGHNKKAVSILQSLIKSILISYYERDFD